ncbi:diguanylate cyclase [Cellulomonas sp. URHE0023]|uniref:GGDEF domain-containing protein n=1 Tax=Cellulomonas sp. URHE0023 TaxID=1380354 RepID=UPI0006892900|nr:diguanylate cyclase [Cellulomonas sp. URHE0023]
MTTELVVCAEFDVFDELADLAHFEALHGDPAGALLLCDVALAVTRGVGAAGLQTTRYLEFTRSRILGELGRAAEALESAERLYAMCADDLRPYWRAKALAMQANAAVASSDVNRAVELLGEAWVLVGTVDGASYNQVSAAAIIANTLAQVELFENADELLRHVHRLFGPELASQVVVDALRFLAEWSLRLLVMGANKEAGERLVELASRAALFRRLMDGSTTDRNSHFADVAEAFALSGLGDTVGARVVLERIWRGPGIDPRRIEWLMMVCAYGYVLLREGRYDEAEVEFQRVRAQAIESRRDLWLQTADAVLVMLDRLRFGKHPALARFEDMFRRVARQLWAERQGRFLAVRRQMRIQELVAQSERAAVLSTLDPLTGVGNRRAIQNLIGRSRGPLSAVFVDVDLFKEVNDEHSHVVGDDVLVRLARLLGRQVRGGDLLARFGGDEFIVILGGDGLDLESSARVASGAELVAERILDEVRAEDWSSYAPGLEITVSLGVAHVEDPRTLLDVASRALRQAKHTGRDRVSVSQAA